MNGSVGSVLAVMNVLQVSAGGGDQVFPVSEAEGATRSSEEKDSSYCSYSSSSTSSFSSPPPPLLSVALLSEKEEEGEDGPHNKEYLDRPIKHRPGQATPPLQATPLHLLAAFICLYPNPTELL